MIVKKYSSIQAWGVLVLLFGLGLVSTACSSGDIEIIAPKPLETWLLVRAPEGPLPVGKSLNVRSRSEDVSGRISHVELHAVELPSGERNILIRADEAPFQQTSFTASQRFTPVQTGHYVIKVVGYNNQGERAESEYISFDVVER